MRIGYGKLGRSMKIDPQYFGMQGDPEAPNLLLRLAERNPDDEFYVIGKHDGHAGDMAPNVIDPWPGEDRTSYTALEDLITGLDGVILHVGQHGTTCMPTPSIKDRDMLTSPLQMSQNYGAFLLNGLNLLGDRTNGQAPVVWLCPDPRNYLKCRDLKWPTGTTLEEPILAQYSYLRMGRKHERWGDDRLPDDLDFAAQGDGSLWVATHHYAQSGLELSALPADWDATWGRPMFDERQDFGIASTAFWSNQPTERRSSYTKRIIDAYGPDFEIWGKWDDESLAEIAPFEVGVNKPAGFQSLLESWKCTVAFSPPARGGHDKKWVAAKPWHAFAAGTVCFFIGYGDAQGWIVPARAEDGPKTFEVGDGLWSIRDDWTTSDLRLARWLRCDNAAELAKKVRLVADDQHLWQQLVEAQWALLQRRWDLHELEETIMRRFR